jgi:hypothetical protein
MSAYSAFEAAVARGRHRRVVRRQRRNLLLPKLRKTKPARGRKTRKLG